MFQVCCAAYQRINHPLIMRNSPLSLLPPPKAHAAPAASHAGWRRCRGTPPVPPQHGSCHPAGGEPARAACKAPTKPQPGMKAPIPPASLQQGCSPRAIPHPDLPRRLGCSRESASSAERQGRASAAPPAPSLRQCRAARSGLGAAPAGASPLGAPGCTSSSRQERFPSPALLAPSASMSLRTGALLQPG